MSELQPPLDLRPEIRAMLREFQEENLQLALPVVTLLGILLILSHRRFSDPLHAGVPGLVLLVVPWLAWSARGLGRSVPAWVLVAGCVLADLLVAGWGRAPVALCALFLPVGIAGLCLGLPSSVLVAAGLTALLLRGPMPLRGEDPNLSGVAILGVWGSAAVVWQAQRPLMGVVEWSWANYKWSRSLLEQARDDQVRLKQTLADLADANSQLNRLNNLAQGLR
ncbi:MAG: hypothetical protein K6V36_13145, partial [Anaerolineae bacterium]|nr:hypothetical protein [Anaerolineae bacterium]